MKPTPRKFLLFDDALVERKHGFRLALHPAQRRDGPVLVADQPWEQGGIMGDSGMTVMEHAGEYKLWYTVRLSDAAKTDPSALRRLVPTIDFKNLDEKTRNDLLSQTRYLLCHATSDDGCRWKKPRLGVIDVAGNKRNNGVFTARLGATVFLDPTAPPRQRFKMIYGGGPRLPHSHYETPERRVDLYHAIYGAASADGVHWTPYRDPIMPWYTDSTNVAYWDDRIKKYAAFVRINQDMVYRDGATMTIKPGGWKYRAIGRSESPNFRSFPPPAKVASPPGRDRRPGNRGIDFYNSSAMKCPGAEDAYFMFSSDNNNDNGMLDVHLATSRDGVKYRRWQEPFLGVGRAGSFDSRRTYMASGMVDRGDEQWMYYLGYNYPHACPRYPRGSAELKGTTGVGRVRVPKDRFVSQTAAGRGGELVTTPFTCHGKRLRINMDASAGGVIRVEILNDRDRPCRGYTEADADPLGGNSVHQVVSWKGDPDVSRLAGRKIRLKFTGKAVHLFAFELTGNNDSNRKR